MHAGRQVDATFPVSDVIHTQCFILAEAHRQALRREPYNVHVWHFEQYQNEMVFIPGGCPHQVGCRLTGAARA